MGDYTPIYRTVWLWEWILNYTNADHKWHAEVTKEILGKQTFTILEEFDFPVFPTGSKPTTNETYLVRKMTAVAWEYSHHKPYKYLWQHIACAGCVCPDFPSRTELDIITIFVPVSSTLHPYQRPLTVGMECCGCGPPDRKMRKYLAYKIYPKPDETSPA